MPFRECHRQHLKVQHFVGSSSCSFDNNVSANCGKYLNASEVSFRMVAAGRSAIIAAKLLNIFV